MKVKITGRNEYVIEHDDKEAIRNVVGAELNRYIEVEYIEYDWYSDAPVNGMLYVVGTNIRSDWTVELTYSTIQSPYGRICDDRLSVILWTNKLCNLFAADAVVISENGQKNSKEIELKLPPKYTPHEVIDDGTTKYTAEAEEMREICKLVGEDISDISDNDLSCEYFDLFVHGGTCWDFCSTEQKAEWIKTKNIPLFKQTRYFKSFAWKFKKERTYTGLTQTEIAEAIKTSKRNIENWESGSSVPNVETQERVINQLKEMSKLN